MNLINQSKYNKAKLNCWTWVEKTKWKLCFC